MPASFKQRAMLIDEIWHAAGDRTAEIDWYIKRAVLGGIYSASEIFMLTDNSPGFKFDVSLNKFTPNGSSLHIDFGVQGFAIRGSSWTIGSKMRSTFRKRYKRCLPCPVDLDLFLSLASLN